MTCLKHTVCSDILCVFDNDTRLISTSRGGGLAIVLKDSLLPHFSWTTSLPFCHTSFELIHATLTLTQKTLHFYALYRPPLNHENKMTDSLL